MCEVVSGRVVSQTHDLLSHKPTPYHCTTRPQFYAVGSLQITVILEWSGRSTNSQDLVCFVGTFGQSQFTHIGVLVGESVTLHCRAWYGDILWRLNSDIIVQYGQLEENYTERFNFSCNSRYGEPCTLTILNAQVEDSGEYWCYDYILYFVEYYSRVTVIRKTHICFSCIYSFCTRRDDILAL